MLRGKFNKISLVLAVLLISNLSANAEITNDEIINKSYMHNQGHSNDVVKLVEIQKARAEGREIPIADTRYKVGKWYLPQKYSTFMRNLIQEKDATLYTNEFGTPAE
ncbi:MAG: hypothetical protein ACD_20C00399G0019 [uncultured bacterium]|nr:MAG: hypothetical protein ACD_20C00399G0019 [uncultured bacterium]HBH19329.1 hypothetical protein [Cyanobacteria bacterium UBA9579]